MAKDSYWFRHDSSAGRAIKMRKMAHIYGHWGKGVYWDVVEILRDQENYLFECDTSSLQLLCDLIGCKDETKFLNWFEDCLKIGLFSLEDSFFYCEPLCENMKVWEAKKTNGAKGGRPRKQREETETKPKQNLTNNLKESITEQNRTEQKITTEDSELIETTDDIKQIEVIYQAFINEIKEGKHQIWAEQTYMQLKLKKGSLTNLIQEFKSHLLRYSKIHPNIKEFKEHLNNWLNTQDQIGKLNQYKTKAIGAL